MNTHKKMINRTAVALVALWAGLLCTQAIACPPPDCPDCTSGTWPDCEWDCSSGQDCCDNVCCSGTCCGPWNSCCPSTHCQGCLNGQCQSTCKSADCETCISHTCKVCEGDTSKTCCNGDCCSSDQCCTGSGCVTLDNDWKTSSELTVEVDPALIGAVSDAIALIPGMPSVEFTSIVPFSYAEERDCCDGIEHTVKTEKCAYGMGVIAGSVNKVTLWSFNESLVISVGDLFGASLSVNIEAYIEGSLGSMCSIGKYINECTGESCNTGSVSMNAGTTLGASASLKACLIILGAEFCVEAGVEASGTIAFSGSVRMNQCGACDGFSGNISLDTLRVDASFWANGHSDNKSWDLLSQN